MHLEEARHGEGIGGGGAGVEEAAVLGSITGTPSDISGDIRFVAIYERSYR
jgi:hypothetical protein